MIVALLNQKGGVGKTTLALHLAGHWGRQRKRVTLIDADPQGSALDWSEQRAWRRFARLFGVVGLARDTLHREAPELARDADHVVIEGPPRIAALLRSALLAADAVLVPAQPSPFDGWASAEMLGLIAEAWIKTLDHSVSTASASDLYTASLTVDITPALRGRIKIAAFQRGETVADMLRALLTREFPDTDGGN